MLNYIHAFMHSCLVQLRLLQVRGKKGESNTYYISCGTLIWVKIIPVKVESVLTGITRTYIIFVANLPKNATGIVIFLKIFKNWVFFAKRWMIFFEQNF